jgi:UrcA family protein
MISHRNVTRSRFRLYLCMFVLQTLTLVPAASVLARSPVSPALPQIVVHYDDLNLSGDNGAKILLRRMEGAARRVCGDNGERISLIDYVPFRRCYAQALEQGVSIVAAERLTRLYRAKYGRAATTYTVNRTHE